MRKFFCFLFVFLFLFSSIPVLAATSDAVTGSLSNGYSAYIPIDFFDNTDSLTISASVSYSFTLLKESANYNVYVNVGVEFFDSNYESLFSDRLIHGLGYLNKSSSPLTKASSNTKEYTSSDFDTISDVAYVRFHAYPSSGVTGTYSSLFNSGSYSLYGEGTVRTVIDAVDEQTQVIKDQHQEEIDKADEASSSATEGLGQVTDVLSTWEIITLPVTVTKDLITAISSEGDSSLTFPSFTLEGEELWPSYTFDLQVIADNFPLLYNSLHIFSSIVLVSFFIRYLWTKWHVLTGDDVPNGG